MSHNIYATFENRDAAERAASRLRKKGVAFRFSIRDSYDANVSSVRSAPASMNLLFPYQPPNTTQSYTNTYNPYPFGRAILTSDTLGMPIYPGGGETRACVTVDDEHYNEVHAILRNCGAYDLR